MLGALFWLSRRNSYRVGLLWVLLAHLSISKALITKGFIVSLIALRTDVKK